MKKIILYLILIVNIIFYSNIAFAKVVSNKIYIGTTISLTGENTSKALLLKKQYDSVIKNINDKGGAKVGGKLYKFEFIYYDDESNYVRANNLITRLILNDGVQFIIAPNNLKLFDNTKDIIKKYHITITTPKGAISNYKDAFEVVNSFEGKEISKFLREYEW